MDMSEALSVVRQYKSVLDANHIRYEHLFLFGSYARGTATEESDLDVAVFVEDDVSDYLSACSLLGKLRRGVDDRLEPHLLSLQNDESGFASEVMKTGIEV